MTVINIVLPMNFKCGWTNCELSRLIRTFTSLVYYNAALFHVGFFFVLVAFVYTQWCFGQAKYCSSAYRRHRTKHILPSDKLGTFRIEGFTLKQASGVVNLRGGLAD